MGVRYSLSTIIFNQGIRADSSAHMIADIDACLVQAGWIHTAITGGWEYQAESPDGLQMALLLQQVPADGSDYIRFTPTSADGSRVGLYQKIECNVATTTSYWQIWANICSMFLAPMDDSLTGSGISFACGIPAIVTPGTGPCTAGVTVPTVTELWWSCGSGTDAFSGAADFFASRYASGAFNFSYNGVLYSATSNFFYNPGSDPGTLQLLPVCSTSNVDFLIGAPAQSLKWSNGTPLRTDALLAFNYQIRGQLWDAFLMNDQAPGIDEPFNYSETAADGTPLATSWIGWNYGNPGGAGGGGTWLATLYLLTVRNGLIGNYAY